jgi:DNA-binding NtrC family response regulator
MAKVLLVDDEMTMVQMVGELLRSEGHQVIPFTNGLAAAEKLRGLSPELVIATLGSERARTSGWNVLHIARSLSPPPPVIMLATASKDTALEAMKKGAYDCLNKPFTLDELKLRVQRALSYQAALTENLSLRKQLQPDQRFPQIITRSPRMQAILNLVERVADLDSPLLIQGQPGTGKQLLARAIHMNSRRHLAPFIPMSCAALPENLLEAELFGERTAQFNSSPKENPGILKEAQSGTIFLERIGSLPLALQGRLLEVLRKREIQVGGEDAAIGIEIRVLAGSDEALEPKLANGTFARELYQRLNVTPIVLPALRERAEDIPLLVSHFLEGKLHARNGKPYAITPEALEACCAYPWPSNVRELETSLQQACLVCQENTIQASDLPRSVQQPATAPHQTNSPEQRNGHREAGASPNESGRGNANPWPERRDVQQPPADLVPLKKYLRDQEVDYLYRTLAQVGGSKERAAELLGISLATIYRKLSEPSSASEETV